MALLRFDREGRIYAQERIGLDWWGDGRGRVASDRWKDHEATIARTLRKKGAMAMRHTSFSPPLLPNKHGDSENVFGRCGVSSLNVPLAAVDDTKASSSFPGTGTYILAVRLSIHTYIQSREDLATPTMHGCE
jgi:hypothetical protein